MPRCVDCVHFTLKGVPQESVRVGLGRCALGPTWRHPSPLRDRQCATFEHVTGDAAVKRAAFERTLHEPCRAG